MPDINIDKFRLARARELETFAEILKKTTICPNLYPLYQAADQCRKGMGDTWGYYLQRLIFNVKHIKKSVPIKVFDVSLELSINVSGHLPEDGEIKDPFNKLEFNMVISGKHNKSGTIIPVMCSWHLDRDEPLPPGGKHDFVHPCYHFQHGGKHTWGATGLDFGNSLIMESPRIAHPPMDAVLGIDFVITNYVKSSGTAFRQERSYKKILIEAQDRVWRPYVQSLAAAWRIRTNENEWHFTRPWPHIMI